MNIAAEDNCVVIGDSAYPKNQFQVKKNESSVILYAISGNTTVTLNVNATTIDDVPADDADAIFDYLVANLFSGPAAV